MPTSPGAIALAATGGMLVGTIGAMFVTPAMLVGRKRRTGAVS